MNRRDFLENTVFGGLLASLAGFFGLELPESVGNRPETARNAPNRPSHGDIRVLGDEDGHLKVEIFANEGFTADLGRRSTALPDPSTGSPPIVAGHTHRIVSIQEFKDYYFNRVGHEPDNRRLWRVANALGVEPV